MEDRGDSYMTSVKNGKLKVQNAVECKRTKYKVKQTARVREHGDWRVQYVVCNTLKEVWKWSTE